MLLHVGIVACSAEGAALCYRTICVEGARRLGGHAHPEVSMHTPSLAAYVHCLETDDLDGVASLMLRSARLLAASGADFLICPDNTIHRAMPRVVPDSPLPWLHIADVVADEAVRRGLGSVGLLGTGWLVASDVYPKALGERGIDCLRPSASDGMAVNRIIMDELVDGRFHDESVARLITMIDDFRTRGADAVILGCTELPLVLDDRVSPLPTLDSTRLLARAALERAVVAGGA